MNTGVINPYDEEILQLNEKAKYLFEKSMKVKVLDEREFVELNRTAALNLVYNLSDITGDVNSLGGPMQRRYHMLNNGGNGRNNDLKLKDSMSEKLSFETNYSIYDLHIATFQLKRLKASLIKSTVNMKTNDRKDRIIQQPTVGNVKLVCVLDFQQKLHFYTSEVLSGTNKVERDKKMKKISDVGNGKILHGKIVPVEMNTSVDNTTTLSLMEEVITTGGVLNNITSINVGSSSDSIPIEEIFTLDLKTSDTIDMTNN